MDNQDCCHCSHSHARILPRPFCSYQRKKRMGGRCANYISSVNGLLTSLGHEVQENDSNLCIDFGSIGARSAESCPAGYSFVPSSVPNTGLCVGGCRKGDQPTTRAITGLKYHDGSVHNIVLPVCVPLQSRAVRKRSGRSRALDFTLMLIAAVALALVCAMLAMRR